MELSNNKFSLFLLSTFLIIGVFLVETNQAKAVGDAYFPQDTTITLSNVNFTITGGSNADEITTDSGTITIKISAGQEIVFKSPDRKILTNDSNFDYSCSTTESSIAIRFPSTTTQKTVTITPSSNSCDNPNTSNGGGGGGGGAVSSTPVTTPAPVPVSTNGPTPVSRGFVSLVALNLREGDIVSAAGSDDPDVYIVNDWGYKRLFLNPVIFGFYGHLGGFSKVKNTVSSTRDTLVTSGLFRNCETNDEKVYGVETTGEDTGMLHWVNTTGAQAIADDSEFFKKVFCINSNEFNWYKKGAAYTSVNQIPAYTRIINE